MCRNLRSTAGTNNLLIINASGLDAAIAMTEGKEAVALELTSLLEDRALMEQEDLDTRLISFQISQLCQN